MHIENIQGTITGRISSAALAEANTPKSSEADAQLNSVTFLNMTGDVTITWSEQNKERMLELIRKKMAEGYNFFTTKRVPILNVERKVRVSKKNIDSIDKLVIPDKEFERLTARFGDEDVAELVRGGHAKKAERLDDKRSREFLKRLEKAEDVLDNQSLALKPMAGG